MSRCGAERGQPFWQVAPALELLPCPRLLFELALDCGIAFVRVVEDHSPSGIEVGQRCGCVEEGFEEALIFAAIASGEQLYLFADCFCLLAIRADAIE